MLYARVQYFKMEAKQEKRVFVRYNMRDVRLLLQVQRAFGREYGKERDFVFQQNGASSHWNTHVRQYLNDELLHH